MLAEHADQALLNGIPRTILLPAFLNPIHSMMRFRIRPVGGKVTGNGVDFILDSIKPGTQRGFNAVDLFGQHLMPFNDNIQLVLKILGHDADMMLEHFLYLFEIIGVHKISQHLHEI
jgi:hypothetical protein